MKRTFALIFTSILLSGCAAPQETFKGFIGISTKEVEEYRTQAVVKVLDFGYDACYAKAEKALKTMENVSIYAKSKELIAVYYVNLNTTPVGVFFKAIDPNRTQVEISSAAEEAREAVAKELFLKFAPPAPKQEGADHNIK